MKVIILGCITTLLFFLTARPAAAQGRKLSDEDLDKISAGSAGNSSVPVAKAGSEFRSQGEAGSTHVSKKNPLRLVNEASSPTATSDVASQKGPTAFGFQGQAGSSHTVNGNGTVSMSEGAMPAGTSNLLLQDQAQQNLRSLINVIAVNSKVQVLVNLNVNINSTVGSVGQGNTGLSH